MGVSLVLLPMAVLCCLSHFRQVNVYSIGHMLGVLSHFFLVFSYSNFKPVNIFPFVPVNHAMASPLRLILLLFRISQFYCSSPDESVVSERSRVNKALNTCFMSTFFLRGRKR